MGESTEDVACRYREMDRWNTPELLSVLWAGQMQAMTACVSALPALAAAVKAATQRLGAARGRLVYAGAGTSGVIATLDAVDLGHTFDWPDGRLLIVIAEGLDLTDGLTPVVEDDEQQGRQRVAEHGVGADDVVIGVSASGASAFTIGIVDEARRRGALTIGLTSMPDSPLTVASEHPIVVATGAEVLAGCTRLGAGTAQKVMLNLFSTALMTGLGRVYENLMVNLRPANARLWRRSIAIVARVARVDDVQAEAALKRHGDVNRAILGLAGVPDFEIPVLIGGTGGNLRAALDAAFPSRRKDLPT
jgi:N-acetylmuramic acid 6-phosphate etherase